MQITREYLAGELEKVKGDREKALAQYNALAGAEAAFSAMLARFDEAEPETPNPTPPVD